MNPWLTYSHYTPLLLHASSVHAPFTATSCFLIIQVQTIANLRHTVLRTASKCRGGGSYRVGRRIHGWTESCQRAWCEETARDCATGTPGDSVHRRRHLSINSCTVTTTKQLATSLSSPSSSSSFSLLTATHILQYRKYHKISSRRWNEKANNLALIFAHNPWFYT